MLLLLLLIHDRDWSVAEGLTVPTSRVRAISTASERLEFGFGFENFVDRFSDGEKRDLPLQPKEGMDSIGTVASRSRDR